MSCGRQRPRRIPGPVESDIREEQERWLGEFRLVCSCGNDLVRREDTRGFSPESGHWGGIFFRCVRCKKRTPFIHEVDSW